MKRPYNVLKGHDEMAKKKGSVKRDQFTSGASLRPGAMMGINGAECIYGVSRRPPWALEPDVNIGGIGGIRGGGITRPYRVICM